MQSSYSELIHTHPDGKTRRNAATSASAQSGSALPRAVVVLPSLHLGGAERQALLLARHLAHEGHAHVQVWGFGPAGRVTELCDEAGIPWRSIALPPGGARLQQLAAFAGFGRLLRQACPDAILPYTLFPNALCGLWFPWSGARVCVWNQRDKGLGGVKPWMARAGARRTPQFVSNSEHGREYLSATYGVPVERIEVIPNAIELAPAARSRAEWRRELGVSEGTFVAGMVANLTRHKDHATLLHAWRLVLDRQNPAGGTPHLVLAGRHDETAAGLQELARTLGLGNSVHFVGLVNDMSGLLSALDVGVLSSRSEGSPNAVLESMAAGLPVVGTDVDGIREAVGARGLSLLAPVGDAQALAEQLLRLYFNPEEREAWGAHNRQRIQGSYAPERVMAQSRELLARYAVIPATS